MKSQLNNSKVLRLIKKYQDQYVMGKITYEDALDAITALRLYSYNVELGEQMRKGVRKNGDRPERS